MRKIAIGEELEYARRLSEYLVRNVSDQLRIYSFTSPKHLKDCTEEADLYLLGEKFYEELEEMRYPLPKEKMILLSEQEKEGYYCKWSHPGKLVEKIREWEATKLQEDERQAAHRITAVYSPSPGMNLRQWLWPYMKEGDLYLGFEDMKDPMVNESRMGELSYYIHLHDAEILEILSRMALSSEEKYYVESPGWFFDFLGLGAEDYHWLYQVLREGASYKDIYVGLGNAGIPSLEYFKEFDRFIIFLEEDNDMLFDFCERLVHTLVEEGYMAAHSIKYIYRGSRYEQSPGSKEGGIS